MGASLATTGGTHLKINTPLSKPTGLIVFQTISCKENWIRYCFEVLEKLTWLGNVLRKKNKDNQIFYLSSNYPGPNGMQVVPKLGGRVHKGGFKGN